MVDLGTFGGTSSAAGVSADGSVVVGYAQITGDSVYTPSLDASRRHGRSRHSRRQ